MSKTAPKNTKKPTRVRQWTNNELMKALTADHDGLERKLIAIQGSVNMLGQRIDAMRHEQVALSQESRSAPAEEWVPEVGDLVALVNVKYDQIGTVDCRDVGFGRYGVTWGDGSKSGEGSNNLRPATEAEIASHKAKEEQRPREAEWAKFDVLQDGDYAQRTPAVTEVAKLLPQAGPCSLDTECCVWCSDAIGVKPPLIWGGTGFSATKQNELPEQEWIRRAKGTIAKRVEDERAKEMAKVPEFGTRVKWRDAANIERDGVWISECAGTHWIGIKKCAGSVAAQRESFTIID